MTKVVKVFRVLDKEHINEVCRCCLSKDSKTHNILELRHDRLSFIEIFEKLLYTTVSLWDDMPKKVCQPCLTEILRFYTFKKKFDKVGKVLSAIVTNNKIKSLEKTTDNLSQSKKTLLNENLLGETQNATENKDEITIKEEILDENYIIPENEPSSDNKNDIKKIDTEEDIKPNIVATTSQPSNSFTKKRKPKTYTCMCLQTFTTLLKLHRHKKEQKHYRPLTVSCKLCNKSFSQVGILRHQRHFQCKICKTTFTEFCTYYEHQFNHSEKYRYMCEFCGKSFTCSVKFNDHRTVHTGEKPYMCEYCGARYKTSSACALHKRKHNGKYKLVRPKNRREEGCVCHLCGARFTFKRNLQRHQQKQICTKPRLQCSECNMGFPSSFSFCKHFESVHGEGKTTVEDEKFEQNRCEFCKKTYSKREILDHHILVEHKTNNRKHYCKMCYKSCTNAATLKTHMRIHSGEKPFGCNVCSKKFTQKTLLTNHVRIHTGEKPFGCSICSKRFRLRVQLTDHMRVHTGEKPYQCDQCPMKFRIQSACRKHKLRHLRDDENTKS